MRWNHKLSSGFSEHKMACWRNSWAQLDRKATYYLSNKKIVVNNFALVRGFPIFFFISQIFPYSGNCSVKLPWSLPTTDSQNILPVYFMLMMIKTKVKSAITRVFALKHGFRRFLWVEMKSYFTDVSSVKWRFYNRHATKARMHPDWPQLHQIFFFSVQGGPDTPIDFVLGNPGSGSRVGCLPSLRSSCSLVQDPNANC